MEQLPKIVQQRLRGPAKPGVHPDPDLLTAFAEKSLNDRERARVLQHLVECADCREVLSLAMPEIEPALAPGPERSNWLSWPVLRWGALAACVVVVGAAVTLHYEHQEAMRSVAEKVPAAPADLKLEDEVSQAAGSEAGGKSSPAVAGEARIATPAPRASWQATDEEHRCRNDGWGGGRTRAGTGAGQESSGAEQQPVGCGPIG